MTPPTSNPSWPAYYQKVGQRPPRDLFLKALERFPKPMLAVDLGCGAGVETRELLKRGWQVVAVDQEAAAFEYLLGRVPPEQRAHLTMQCESFSTMTLPKADFLWAGLSLPFCPPEQFAQLWEKITESVRSGGYFAGDLFGVRHAWRENKELTFVTLEEVRVFLKAFEIEHLVEVEEERSTAFEGMQHWHGFDVIARKV
jgi:tellurite methyltransferase